MDTKPQEKTIDDEIKNALDAMERIPVGTEKYTEAARAVDMLCHARSQENKMTIKGIPIESIIAAGVNLIGILLVLNYERFNVITTKAFGMVSKGRNV